MLKGGEVQFFHQQGSKAHNSTEEIEMDAIDYSMINVGAWVRATGHLGAGENRAMKVRTMFVRNGRIGFDAMVSTRDGDPRRTPEERMVWRYMDQVTEVVRAARTRTDWTAERKNLPNG